jgi:Na+/phosphate symporter
MRKGEGKRLAPVSTAVMTLAITFVMYIPGATIGLALLHWGTFNKIKISFPHQFSSLIDVLYGWLLNRIEDVTPLLLFVGGLALLIVSFKILDSLVPEFSEEQLSGSRVEWLRKKWPMFGLGIVVCIATLSVSVALTVLVPLVAKGFLKREDLIPYIVGADIGTLVDKLLVAFLTHSAVAVRIILAEIIGVGLIGLLIIAFFYPQFKRVIWRFQRQVVKSKPRLAVFTGMLFITPVLIILLSSLVG